MAKTQDRMERRHIREKSVIDHLAKKVFEPTASTEDDHATQDATTSTGLPVENQVRKEWNPKKGGSYRFSTGNRRGYRLTGPAAKNRLDHRLTPVLSQQDTTGGAFPCNSPAPNSRHRDTPRPRSIEAPA